MAIAVLVTVAWPQAQKKGGASTCSVTSLWDAPGFAMKTTIVQPGKRLGISIATARVAVPCAGLSDAVLVAAGNGRTDLLTGTVEFYLLHPSDGAPITCQPHVSVQVPHGSAVTGDLVWTLTAGNLDGNEVPDFVSTSRTSEEAYAFLGSRNSSGLIQFSVVSIPRPNDQSQPIGKFAYAAALADLDGVAGDEIVVGAPGTWSKRSAVPGRLALYKFRGATATTPAWFERTGMLTAPDNDSQWNFGYTLAIGDVTGDSLPDIVTSSISQSVNGVMGAGAVYVYPGAPGGTWQAPRLLHAAVLADEAYGYRASIADAGRPGGGGDHRADGFLDVIATTGWNGPDTRLDITPLDQNSGLGTTPEPSLKLEPAPGLEGGWGTGDPSIADVNGDGDPDVFVGAMNATPSSACNSPGVAYAFLSDPAGSGAMTRYRLAAPTPDPDFAGFGRWVVGVTGTPLVLVTEQGRNVDATTEGAIYVFTAPPAPQP